MTKLTYHAKWTVLDTETMLMDDMSTEDIRKVIAAVAAVDPSDLPSKMMIELGDDFVPASSVGMDIGRVHVEGDEIALKHVEFEFETDLDHEEFIETHGEHIYIEALIGDIKATFIPYESFGIYDSATFGEE